MKTMIVFALLLALLLSGGGAASAQESALFVNRGYGLVMERRFPDWASCDSWARTLAESGAQAGCSLVPADVLQEERRQAERKADIARQEQERREREWRDDQRAREQGRETGRQLYNCIRAGGAC